MTLIMPKKTKRKRTLTGNGLGKCRKISFTLIVPSQKVLAAKCRLRRNYTLAISASRRLRFFYVVIKLQSTNRGAKRYSFAARSSAAMSNFFIVIIACMALGCLISSPIRAGTTCQRSPNLSLSHPQAISPPPPPSSSFE